jgi:hypothetical protein
MCIVAVGVCAFVPFSASPCSENRRQPCTADKIRISTLGRGDFSQPRRRDALNYIVA